MLEKKLFLEQPNILPFATYLMIRMNDDILQKNNFSSIATTNILFKYIINYAMTSIYVYKYVCTSVKFKVGKEKAMWAQTILSNF